MAGITKREQYFKQLLIDYGYEYLYRRIKNPRVKPEDKQTIALRICSSDISRNQTHEVSGDLTIHQLMKDAYADYKRGVGLSQN